MQQFLSNPEETKALIDMIKQNIGGLTVSQMLGIQQELNKLTNEITKEKAEVHFRQEAWYKMLALVKQCDKEIAWDGIVERDTENQRVFYITDIIVYPQIISGATVETDDTKYTNWLNSLSDDIYNKRRFNGHSHVNMGCTPSSTDTTYREQSIKNVTDFFIFAIFNKKTEHTIQIYDVENNIVYENKDIDIYTPEPDYTEWANESIKEFTEERKTVYNNFSGYGGYGAGYNRGNAVCTAPVTSNYSSVNNKKDEKKETAAESAKGGVSKKDAEDKYEAYMREQYGDYYAEAMRYANGYLD